jgi:beta-lactamase class D
MTHRDITKNDVFLEYEKHFLKNNTKLSLSNTDISGNKTDIQWLKNSLKYFDLRKKKLQQLHSKELHDCTVYIIL